MPRDQQDRQNVYQASTLWFRRIWPRLRFRRIFGGVDTYPHGQVFTLVGVTRLSGKLVLLSERIMESRSLARANRLAGCASEPQSFSSS